ncbi:TetR/AcrR family transcriptional regulator, partial [Streptococcus pneumoniae]|nr:TetR/AcrR family transcriptional regulator [Streptococcus pneumoniae]
MSKKQQILESALQLFAENGIEATSVQHITQEAGISKGAFYLSFPSKESLIKEIIDSFMKGFVADIDRVVNS